MAVWSEIKTIDTIKPKRIDSEYFKPDYIVNEKKVRKLKHSNLSWFGNFVPGPFGSAFHVKNYDISSPYRYVRGKDVKPFILQNDDNVYIPEKDYIRLIKYSLNEYDLLISVVGTLGNISIVTSDDIPAIFSCKSTVFRSNQVDAYFLLAYLNSFYGKQCLLRRTRGAVQTGLNIDDLKTVPVPLFPDPEISQISSWLKEALSLGKKSESLYTEAQQLLEKELGLDEIEFDNPIGHEASYSEVLKNYRLDADFYQPKYLKLEKTFHKFRVEKVSYISEKLETGIYSPSYSDNGNAYIRGIDIDNKGQICLPSLVFTKSLKKAYSNTVKEKDILVTRVGSVGVCGIVPSSLNSQFFSDNLIRIRIRNNLRDDISAHYLNLFLISRFGEMLMIRYSRGSVQQRLNQTQLAQIPIPIIDFEKQKEIEEIILQFIKNDSLSKQLLTQAKQRVEELIEKEVN